MVESTGIAYLPPIILPATCFLFPKQWLFQTNTMPRACIIHLSIKFDLVLYSFKQHISRHEKTKNIGLNRFKSVHK